VDTSDTPLSLRFRRRSRVNEPIARTSDNSLFSDRVNTSSVDDSVASAAILRREQADRARLWSRVSEPSARTSEIIFPDRSNTSSVDDSVASAAILRREQRESVRWVRRFRCVAIEVSADAVMVIGGDHRDRF
jgi:hypothetical protein